ncbi:nicotinate phosphoribosyltransferase [Gottfriedia acidiceleris]|uniref:nicotinate phosphoribosyltransferase n=1 Tax=Gottfriedia acidiceleris TaxID=371036 RepID=UPI0033994AC6
MTTIYPATLLCDFYKVSHKDQYPVGTEKVYSTWTPRSNKYLPQADGAVVFGIQAFVKKYLIKYFNENFFNRPLKKVVDEYKRVIKFTLGVEEPDATHIKDLWELGYLPIKVKALKEGTIAPIKVPILTIENTNPKFFWITNYLETLISNEIWLPMTSATVAYAYRQLLDKYALKTVGSTDGVEFSAHDFSMRGMGSLESSKLSGAGHLLSFVGTDTIPAIMFHEEFYNADIEKELVGTSISATEHSVMCSYGQTNEFELFKHLITTVYPEGFFSVVSDTWDFWKVVTEYLPALKDDIMARDGRVVIRPDSGDPVKIICGDFDSNEGHEIKGLIECLWDTFGGTVNELGYKVLDPHIGAIYGDSITLERAETIVQRLEEKGFASTNIVFGVGSFTYQMKSRDSLGFAMKATYAVVNGEERMLFKDPKTDDGTKRSQRGMVHVYSNNGEIKYVDGLTKNTIIKGPNLLETVFEDGKLLRDETLSEIRERLLSKDKVAA